jgi:ubiquinone/menaquinone biosynthesis C-methylase UbiE
MKRSSNWKDFFDEKCHHASSDLDYDRGFKPLTQEIENLAEQELLTFIDPQPAEVVFDAGCGTGANIELLYPLVKRIFGMDYSQGAIERCRTRIQTNAIENAEAHEGSILQIPLEDYSVDKVICMSVLQFLDDREVERAFTEFARILKDRGTLVLHVKNLSSIYLSTLWLVKQIKLLFGKDTKLCHYRSCTWYSRRLRSSGFEITDYNSFNICILPKMPARLVAFIQRIELRNYRNWLFRMAIVRGHGSDLKLKAIRTTLRTPARNL